MEASTTPAFPPPPPPGPADLPPPPSPSGHPLPAADPAPDEEKWKELVKVTLDLSVWSQQGDSGGTHVVELKMAVKKLLSKKPWIRENYVTQAF